MVRSAGVLALLLVSLVSCRDEGFIEGGCGAGALCALQFTLVVTGEVRVSGNPVVGALVGLKAYQGGCSGAEVMMLPSPPVARTDSSGVYQMHMQPTQAAAAGCLHVAVSDTLFTDATGIAWHVPPATADTVHVNLSRP